MKPWMYANGEIDGRTVEYRAGGDDDEFPSPVLIINVDGLEDAEELLATLERSFARKRKDSPPAAAAAVPGFSGPETAVGGQEAPKCAVEGCKFDAEQGTLTCRGHHDDPPTPKAEAKKRAGELVAAVS